MYNEGLFLSWVSKPLQLFFVFFLLIGLMSINGVYVGNANFMVGSTGLTYEVINFCNNALTIGMAMGMALIVRLKLYMKVRTKFILGFMILIGLSYVTAKTDNQWVLAISSFIIGFVRMNLLIVFAGFLMALFAPNGDKGRFYPIYYPIIICISQLSYVLAVYLGDRYTWEVMHLVMMIYFLVALLIVIIFMHNQYFSKPLPLYYVDWFSMLLFSYAYLSLDYCFSFMKQKGWFIDDGINFSLISGIIILIVAILRQGFLNRPFLDLSGLKRKNVRAGLILLFMIGVYLGTSSLQTQWTNVLGYSNYTVAKLNYFVAIGVVIGGILGFIGFKNKWSFKYYILLGYGSYIAYVFLIYSWVSPNISIGYFQFMSIFRGMGMIVLFIGVWYYSVIGLNVSQTFSTLSILLAVRTFFSVSIAMAIYSYLFYKFQWQSLDDIGSNFDMINYSMNGSVKFSTVQSYAILDAVKEVAGCILMASVVVVLFVLTHQFGSLDYKRVIVLRRRLFTGNKLKGYRFLGIKF